MLWVVKTKAAVSKNAPATDLSTPQSVKEFQEAAIKFTKWATHSKARARQVLVDEGIYTKDGRLTENYR